MSKHKRECVAICIEAGLLVYDVDDRRRHIAVSTAKGTLFFPSTPGDRRWRQNMTAVARRLARQ